MTTTTNNTKRKLLIVRSSEKTLKFQEHKLSPNTAETFLFFVVVKNDLIHPPLFYFDPNLPVSIAMHNMQIPSHTIPATLQIHTHSTYTSRPRLCFSPPFSFRGGRFGFVVGGLRVCRDRLTTCDDDTVCRRCCSYRIILLLLQILFIFATLFPRRRGRRR